MRITNLDTTSIAIVKEQAEQECQIWMICAKIELQMMSWATHIGLPASIIRIPSKTLIVIPTPMARCPITKTTSRGEDPLLGFATWFRTLEIFQEVNLIIRLMTAPLLFPATKVALITNAGLLMHGMLGKIEVSANLWSVTLPTRALLHRTCLLESMNGEDSTTLGAGHVVLVVSEAIGRTSGVTVMMVAAKGAQSFRDGSPGYGVALGFVRSMEEVQLYMENG